MKTIIILFVTLAAILLSAVPSFAQGGFKDTVWMRYTVDYVLSVRISKTNKYIATTGQTHTFFYDFNNGNEIYRTEGYTNGFFINNDSKFIRINKSRNGVEIIDLATWQLIDSLENDGLYLGDFPYADISNNEKYLAITNPLGFKIWDIPNRKLISQKIFPPEKDLINLNLLTIKLFRDNSKIVLQIAKTFNNPSDPYHPIIKGFLNVYDFNTLDSIDCLGNGNYYRLSKTNKYYSVKYSATDNGVKVFNLNTKALIWTLPINGASLTGMEFTPDDKYLVTSNGPTTDALIAWDMKTGKPYHTYLSASYDSFNISTDGDYIAAGNGPYLILYHSQFDGSSVSKEKETPINVYPNPTNDIITLKPDCGDSKQFYEIYNINGMKLFQSAQVLTDGENISIDFSDYSTGVYFIQLHCGTSLSTYKIIKQ